MPEPRPHRVVLERHAAERAQQYGWTTNDVADLVLGLHHTRRRNSGRAEWRIVGDVVTVLYDWPDGDDTATVRVVSMWATN